MLRLALRITVVVCTLLSFRAAFAQEAINKMTAPAAAPLITAVASAERLRFTAPNTVVQMQLQIYSDAGKMLFDASSKGNVLDWTLQDGGGEQLVPGSYLCVVTVKSISGKLSQRIGSALVQEKQVELRPVDPTQFTAAQQQAVGPIEENGALTILKSGEPEANTVLANDGQDGQLIRGRGALSFRIGDFFSGTDKEQMRLTEEGNLGIGTTKPEARLDVAGMIRARQGFLFSNGSSLNVNDKGALTLTNSEGNVVPNVGGTGTQGRLAKWTDSSGTLGDSIAVDTGTGLQLTVPPSASVDTNLLYTNANDRTMGVIASSAPAFTASNGPFFALRGNSYTAIGGGSQRGVFAIAAGDIAGATGRQGSIVFNTGPDQVRMTVKPTGDVGIGTETPAAKLDVVGDINTATQYNIGGYRVLSVTGGISTFRNSNTLAGVGAGAATFPFLNDVGGNYNSFFGSQAGVTNTVGYLNSFFGFNAGRANTFGNSNSFFGSSAGYSNTEGFLNTFVGSGSGLNNQTGKEDSFFGYAAGQNSKGDANTFIGFQTGSNLNSGSNNTMLGTAADVGADNLDHATAIGAGAVVSTSNTIALGRGDGSDTVKIPGALNVTGSLGAGTVGIGTTAPINILHLNGNQSNFALTFTNQANTAGKRGYRVAFDNDRFTFQSADDSGNFAANQMAIDPATGNIGIGTVSPHAKLQVAGGNIYVTNPNGVIISSPNGTCWQIGVSNAGALTTIPTPCP